MGNLINKADTPSEELEIFHPTPWPQQHCDSQGRCQSYKSRGRWVNHWQEGRPHHLAFLWRWYTGKDYCQVPCSEELDTIIPIRHPQWNENDEQNTSSGQQVTSSDEQITSSMTWLGHATVVARVDGVNLLLDPVFSSRASAVQWIGPARYRDAACRVDQLPRVAAVLITHNHYDHLDLTSVREIVSLQPWVEWFLPAGVSAWMEENTQVDKSKLHDMEWWEELELAQTGIKIAFTPSNHWSKRTLTDDYKTLWGSFAVLGPKTKFWFGGDTAYCEAFKQIGEQYGPFQMAAIPIGAYQPNWFLKYNHIHPREAIQIHKDLRSERSMAIHWGTFKLTVEHFLEPKQLLMDSLEKDGVGKEEFLVPDIGEAVVSASSEKGPSN